MGLAGARATDENHVARFLGEDQIREIADRGVIDVGVLEVEAGEIAMHRELGGVQLVSECTCLRSSRYDARVQKPWGKLRFLLG